MDKLNRHWTANTTQDFVFRISSDFVVQLEKKMDAEQISKKEFGTRLGLTESRVSQIFNTPSNLKLRSTVEYARALGLKVAIVAYDDKDPDNNKGPINSEIFAKCWERAGAPQDFYDLKMCASSPLVVFPTRYPSEPMEADNIEVLVRRLQTQRSELTAKTVRFGAPVVQ